MRLVTALTVLLTLTSAAFVTGPFAMAAEAADAATPNPPAAAPATATPISAASAEPAVASATVEAARVTEVLAQVPVSGTLVPRQEVQVFPQVSGFEIREILAEAGDQVAEGQVLVRLSDDTLRAQLAQAEAEHQRAEAGVAQAKSQIASADAALAQAASALQRAQKLKQSGNTAQASLDQAVAAEAAARAQASVTQDGVAVAQAVVAQATAARDIARLNLARTEIRAPVAGVITLRNAELGTIASPGDAPLFTLVAGGEIELAAEVIETALPALTPGAPAAITVAGIGVIAGEVRLVPARVDVVTRLGVARISLTDSARLRPGLFASGWITTDRHDAVTVPATAVLAEGLVERVQVVANGKVESRAIDAGLLWQGRREIVDGLKAGEVVIARAGAFFRDGDPVNAVRAQPAPAPTGATAATVADAAAGGTAP